MKYFAAPILRSVRTARLSHLRLDAVIGSFHVPVSNGAFQVFDVVMQPEKEFMHTKIHLSAPAVQPLLQGGQVNVPYVVKDIRQIDIDDELLNPRDMACEHFQREFKL